jgi:hypothetical protein
MSTNRSPQNREGAERPESAARPFKQPASPLDPAKAEALEAAGTARLAGWQIGDEGDSLHGKIILTLKDRAYKLFRQAAEDPDSEANTIVQIMLLNQIGEIEAARYQADPKLVLTEERHRGIEHDMQAEMAKHRITKLDADTAKATLEIDRLRHRIEKLKQELEAGKMKLDQARRVVGEAQVNADLGRPMDPQEVYRRIFEIVGLQAPAEAGPEAATQ